MNAARKQARESFKANRNAIPGGIEAEQGIQHAKGVAQILRENVVQGQRDREDPGPFSESSYWAA